MKKIYFENLNGLRFIAFVSIFFGHSIFTTDSVVANSSIYHFLHLLQTPAGLGVPFFFCLSGFLITYILISEVQKNGKINIGNFYMRRILRIWLLYYLVVIFGFFIFPVLRSFFIPTPYTETATLWKYLAFLSNFDQIEKELPYGAGLGVTWSLSVEEQFYLLWPLMLSIVNPKYYAHLTLILFAIGNILISFFNISYLNTLGSMVDISLGAFLAITCFNKNKLYNFLISIDRKTVIIIYVTGLIHIFTWMYLGIGNRIFTSLFMAFVVFEQTFSKHSFIKMENFKTVSYLGTLTYGLYLLHTICNFFIHNFILVFRNKINMPLFCDLLLQPVLSFILTLIAGYFSFNYLEKPLLNLKEKFSAIETTPKEERTLIERI